MHTNITFDFLMFVLIWPPSWDQYTHLPPLTNGMTMNGGIMSDMAAISVNDMAAKSVNDIATDFTIHGVWPERWDGTWPQFCNRSYQFNLTELGSLTDTLDKVWTNYQPNNNNTEFWSWEWDKHGTCALPVFGTELAYFSQGVLWQSMYRPYMYLDAANISPSKTELYGLSAIQNAVRAGTGYVPHVSCANPTLRGKGYTNVFVSSITLCFDHTGLALIDCPDMTQSCKPWVYYIP